MIYRLSSSIYQHFLRMLISIKYWVDFFENIDIAKDNFRKFVLLLLPLPVVPFQTFHNFQHGCSHHFRHRPAQRRSPIQNDSHKRNLFGRFTGDNHQSKVSFPLIKMELFWCWCTHSPIHWTGNTASPPWQTMMMMSLCFSSFFFFFFFWGGGENPPKLGKIFILAPSYV